MLSLVVVTGWGSPGTRFQFLVGFSAGGSCQLPEPRLSPTEARGVWPRESGWCTRHSDRPRVLQVSEPGRKAAKLPQLRWALRPLALLSFLKRRLRHTQVCKASALKHSRDLAQGGPGRPAVPWGGGGSRPSAPQPRVPCRWRMTDLCPLRPSLDRNLQGSLRGDHQV